MNTGCGRQLVTVINMLTPGVRDRHLLLDLNTRTREAALRQRLHRTAAPPASFNASLKSSPRQQCIYMNTALTTSTN